jgi:hypothetical protein
VAVQAFCQGSVWRGEIKGSGSRWRTYVSLPIVLQAPPWDRLPVGVMNLLSTEPKATSSLDAMADADSHRKVTAILKRVGADILDPAVPLDVS